MKTLIRCSWAGNELATEYHDREWGVPLHDDRMLFEFLILEGAQAGLSWDTILRKRDNYRAAYQRFDPRKVAKFGAPEVAALLGNEGIVRNRLKIDASITNAKAFLQIQKEFGSFDSYVWNFVGGKPKRNTWRNRGQVPASTDESDALSKDLRKRLFVGQHLLRSWRSEWSTITWSTASGTADRPDETPGGGHSLASEVCGSLLDSSRFDGRTMAYRRSRRDLTFTSQLEM